MHDTTTKIPSESDFPLAYLLFCACEDVFSTLHLLFPVVSREAMGAFVFSHILCITRPKYCGLDIVLYCRRLCPLQRESFTHTFLGNKC